MDNKKRLQEGAIMLAVALWVFALIVTVAFVLNNGSAFRVVCALLLVVPNIWAIVKTWKKVQEKFRTLY